MYGHWPHDTIIIVQDKSSVFENTDFKSVLMMGIFVTFPESLNLVELQ